MSVKSDARVENKRMSFYSTESVVGDAALDCPTLEELLGRKPTHIPPLVNGVPSRILMIESSK